MKLSELVMESTWLGPYTLQTFRKTDLYKKTKFRAWTCIRKRSGVMGLGMPEPRSSPLLGPFLSGLKLFPAWVVEYGVLSKMLHCWAVLDLRQLTYCVPSGLPHRRKSPPSCFRTYLRRLWAEAPSAAWCCLTTWALRSQRRLQLRDGGREPYWSVLSLPSHTALPAAMQGQTEVQGGGAAELGHTRWADT